MSFGELTNLISIQCNDADHSSLDLQRDSHPCMNAVMRKLLEAGQGNLNVFIKHIRNIFLNHRVSRLSLVQFKSALRLIQTRFKTPSTDDFKPVATNELN